VSLGNLCCCGDGCEFCSDDITSKTMQITISGGAPAGSCADFDGVYGSPIYDGNPNNLPWLDSTPTATAQDLDNPYNVITLPKYSGTTLDSGVCGWRFESAESEYDPICGECTGCASGCELTTDVDGVECDPLQADSCDYPGAGFTVSSPCDAPGYDCDCLGFHDYSCEPNCTITGYSEDPSYIPCCTCVYDGVGSWLCSCTGGATGSNGVVSLISQATTVWVYRNSSDEVVVYVWMGIYSGSAGLCQVYSGEHVFTGESQIECLSELDGLSITLTDRLTYQSAGAGTCSSGVYSPCDTAASITVTIDFV
jgi:hypothetical protein